MRLEFKHFVARSGIIMSLIVGVLHSSRAATLSILHSFNGGSDGTSPTGNLVHDPNGNIFGTTTNVYGTNDGYGMIFELASSGAFSVLHTFTIAEGSRPNYLSRDASGNLYGVGNGGGSAFFGTVFRFGADGNLTVLYNFQGGSDGAYPYGPLAEGAPGVLYGTAPARGHGGNGAVFRLAANGTVSVVRSFPYFANGGDPNGAAPAFIKSWKGALYGATLYGGQDPQGGGVIFKLTGGKELVLHTFMGIDGFRPVGSLTTDSSGNLYGATTSGGAADCGTIYRISAIGEFTVLTDFTSVGSDGCTPAGGVTLDANGNVYGTTAKGGAQNMGTVFKIAADGTHTILHSFAGTPDGSFPAGELLTHGKSFVGTTEIGGSGNFGTIFQITP